MVVQAPLARPAALVAVRPARGLFLRSAPTFAPAMLEESVVELGGRTIHLRGLYPIYREEVALLEGMGLERFWKHPSYDLYSVTRPNLGR